MARVVFGGLMAAHGAQKYFGWFGGYGLDAVSGMFESLGFRPGRLFATAAAVGEIVSGLLVAAGLLGPIGPALMLSVMIVAAVSVHWQHGLFAMTNGVEVPLLYAAAAVVFALTGPGRLLARRGTRTRVAVDARGHRASPWRSASPARSPTWRSGRCPRPRPPDATGLPRPSLERCGRYSHSASSSLSVIEA